MSRDNPALNRMIGRGRQTAQQAREEASSPPPAPAPTPPPPKPAEKAKRSVGTRLTPELHSWVRRTALDLTDELGRRVYVEQVLEALLLEMREDAALRGRVARRLGRG